MTFFVPGFPMANPFISSLCDISFPEGDGKGEGEHLSNSAYPSKALPAISAVSETGLCSFLLLSRASLYFPGEP